MVSEREAAKAEFSERDRLLGRLLTIQEEQQQKQGEEASSEPFYPDANSCLRLSAGHVEGYLAADAVRHTPVTTL